MRRSCHTSCTWIASLHCHSFHELQWLFSSWILWWYFKSLDHEKLLPHLMHLNGFSPLWFLSWIVMWKSSWYFHGFFPSFLPSYVERLRIAQRCLMLRTTYGKPAPVRIWTGKREIRDHFNHLEVPRIPKSHNTCGFLQKPGRSWLSKLLDSLL